MFNSIRHPHTIFAAQLSSGLAHWEVFRIEQAVEEIEGHWMAMALECECCGDSVARVFSTDDSIEGPTFEIARVRNTIMLTTTCLDDEVYASEFRSLPAALGAMRARIAIANRTRKRWSA